jgi:two-component system phosphate regulon sensor histidine kinase PhoR
MGLAVIFARRAAARADAAARRLAGDARRTAAGLEEALALLRTERDRAAGIVAAMQEGLMVLDADGRIESLNPALCEMLLLDESAVGKRPLEVVRHAALHELIAGGGSAEIDVAGVKPRRLLARASRLGGGGTLVVFFDVTELRRLESLRRDFVANVSHELRTPVTAVRSAAETLRGALARDPAGAARFVDIIERNAERMQELVEDLLELSRIESRQYQLRPEELDAAALLERAVEALRERAEKKGIVVRVEAAGAGTLRADRRAMDRVLANLLDNAIKYCNPGATVRVTAGAGGESVALAIADDGPGIEAVHLPRLFERFYRVDGGRARDRGGTGLGLSIVKHLVEAMGGKVGVTSAPGRGSTFTVTLPRA